MDGTIIDLNERRKLNRAKRAAIHRTARRLREIEEELLDLTVQLAMSGPLAAWSATQAIGSVARIDDEMLLGTGDAQVAALLRLRDQAFETVEMLYGVTRT